MAAEPKCTMARAGAGTRPDAPARPADEYDTVQARGETRKQGGNQTSNAEVCGLADLGISRKEVHEAHQTMDAAATASLANHG